MQAKIDGGFTASRGGLTSPPYIHFPIEITSGYSPEVTATLLPPLISTISTVAPNNPVYLGQLTLLGVRPLKLAEPQAKGQFDLKFEVDEEKIWKVQNVRKNTDICLQIRMEGLAFIERKDKAAHEIDSWSVTVEGMEDRYNYIRIPVGDWISYLEDWGYGKHLLLDIPVEFEVTELGKQGLANRLKEAAKGMQQVKDNQRQGEWIPLVRNCRPILDLLRSEKEITEGITVKKAIKKLIEDYGLPHRHAEGIEQIINGLVTFVQPTHHIVEGKETKIEPPYGKEDAIFVEAALSTLLNMLIKKLTSN